MGIITDASAAEEQDLVVTIGYMQPIDSLNPYVGLNDASYIFYGLIYDALDVIDNDMKPYPDLIEGGEDGDDLSKGVWAVPEDYDPDPKLAGMPYGSVWQYNLTREAYWTDGEPFTSDDVIYNINLNAEPSHYDIMWAYQPYSYYMHEAWKVDEYTVRVSYWDRVTLDPIPAAYAYLISIPMLPKHLMEQLPGGFSYIGMNWSGVFPDSLSPGMPTVGTGPWMGSPSMYSDWLEGDHITLLRNDNYHWQRTKVGSPFIDVDKLVMRFFQDSTSMVLALKKGELDIAAFSPTAYDAIKDDVESGDLKNVTCFDGPKITQYWTEVDFCMAEGGPNPSRLDPAVRHALHMATNKTYIVNNMYLGYAEEGTTLIPPINADWHYEPTAGELFDYDLAAAAALLEANGYIDTDGNGYRDATIGSMAVQMGWVDEGTDLVYQMLVRKEYPEERDIAQYLKTQWEQVGVLLNYLVVEEITLSQIAYSYNYDTLIWYWSADVDPNYQLFVETRAAWYGWSDNKYYNPAYDENYTNSVKTLDKAQRQIYVDNVQKVFYNDSAYIILAYADQTYAWRDDNVVGWGDWENDPGRSADNFWMGNPLWFDLESVIKPEDNKTKSQWYEDPVNLAIVGALAAIIVISVAYLAMRGRKKEGSLKEPESPLGD
jgi:peptide/nickel transport system substrate-binding protein